MCGEVKAVWRAGRHEIVSTCHNRPCGNNSELCSSTTHAEHAMRGSDCWYGRVCVVVGYRIDGEPRAEGHVAVGCAHERLFPRAVGWRGVT